MTKTVEQLKAEATELGLEFPAKIKKDDLIALIEAHQAEADDAGILETIESDAVQANLMTIVKEVKRRKPSARERGEDGKVLRKGRNLSGNQPFQGKNYYYDLDFASGAEYDKAFQAAPMQVRLILKYMKETGITTPSDALRGGEIAGGAINTGYLQSKIEPAALFAYYRRVMERLGLRLASSEGLEEE